MYAPKDSMRTSEGVITCFKKVWVSWDNGKVKFTLENIPPELIAASIEAKLMVKDADNAVLEKTYTASVLDYCKRLMASEEHADWKEATKALLNYVAEVQKATGYEGTLANDGLEAMKAPVDLSTLTGTFTVNDQNAWSVALITVVEGEFMLVVGVNGNANSVRYTIDGVSEVVGVQNGLALIPVNLFDMDKEITLEIFDQMNDATTDAGSFVLTINGVLAEAVKGGADETSTALLQAVANLGKELSALKA